MVFKRIPKKGIEGESQLREAAAGEFSIINDMLRRAMRELLFPGNEDGWVNIQSVFADKLIIHSNGRLYSYPYTIDDNNQVQIGQPMEVVLDYTPVAAHMAEAIKQANGNNGQGSFIEAKDEQGRKWLITVVEAGESLNQNYYPDAVLREGAPLFEGARVFVKSDEEHLKGKGKSFKQLIGQLSNVLFVEGANVDSGQIQADFDVLSSAGDVAAKLLEAFQRNMTSLFGFSMDVNGKAKRINNRRVASELTKVNSVDLIIEPGAGGGIINLIEAHNPEGEADMILRERMIKAVKAANHGVLPSGLDVDNDEALETAYREALAPNNNHDEPSRKDTRGADNGQAGSQAAATGVSRDELNQTIKMVEARANMRATITRSKLPDNAKSKLISNFIDMEHFTEAEVTGAIKAEADYIASFTESGHVAGHGEGSHIEMGQDRGDKVKEMLDGFFDRKNRDVRSFKECYIDITGDKRVTGQLRDTDNARFRESLSDAGNLDVLLGDAIHRAMIRDYREMGQYDVFRPIIDVVPLSDFRTNHRTRLGGYGDLPAVAKSQAYGALASPGDEEATYAPSKRGGTESIALEDIRDDDVGLVQRIPTKLSRAAKRTLAKFVLDFIKNNPVIYDGTNLFTAGHGNLGTAALDATSLAARRLAMVQQKELGSNEELGIGPSYLMVPSYQEETAYNLFNRNTENDKTFVQELSLEILPVWYWDDPNDWSLAADPLDMPGIEIGFLDGQEDPELFVQDNPTNGSMFSNDTLTWKLRHIYGGTIVDFRAFDKSVVV